MGGKSVLILFKIKWVKKNNTGKKTCKSSFIIEEKSVKILLK